MNLDRIGADDYLGRMDKVLEIGSRLSGGSIVTDLDPAAITREVMENKRIVVLKNAFPEDMLLDLRRAVIEWGCTVPAAAADDFRGNYHRQRAMVSRLQQAPHVFHDYNFNVMGEAPPELEAKLRGLFEPLKILYNSLTSHDAQFVVPESGPYVHPQIIHYPSGGGFFGRHWHNLMPQMLGFIVSLSRFGVDFKSGGTVFEIDGQIVDMEGRQELGDICVWRYDYDHWVKQSSLEDKFDWNSEDGRWVATFAYFDPYA